MTTKIEFSPAEIRGMEVMRDRGKTFDDIAYDFGVSVNTIRKALINAGKHEVKKKPKKKKQNKPKTQKEGEKKTTDETVKRWCNITCCNDRKSCTEIDHPQQCLVWRLYNDESKKNLKKKSVSR